MLLRRFSRTAGASVAVAAARRGGQRLFLSNPHWLDHGASLCGYSSQQAATLGSNTQAAAGTSTATTDAQSPVRTPWKKSTGFKWLDSFLGLNSEEVNRIRSTTNMFMQCVRPAKDPAFYEVFGVPREGTREWLAYHNVTGLHVWLMYRRIKAEEHGVRGGTGSGATTRMDANEANVLGQELYDRFWEDCIERVRETKVFEMLVNKHLRKAQEVTIANNVEMDAGILVTNDRDTEFGGALWRTIYRSDETIPEENIEALAKYVRAQHTKLQNLPIEAVIDVKFDWDPPETYAL